MERQQAAAEKATHRDATAHHASEVKEVIQTGVVAIFGRRAREVALAAGATMEQALEAKEKAAAEAEASMADASAMRE